MSHRIHRGEAAHLYRPSSVASSRRNRDEWRTARTGPWCGVRRDVDNRRQVNSTCEFNGRGSPLSTGTKTCAREEQLKHGASQISSMFTSRRIMETAAISRTANKFELEAGSPYSFVVCRMFGSHENQKFWTAIYGNRPSCRKNENNVSCVSRLEMQHFPGSQ